MVAFGVWGLAYGDTARPTMGRARVPARRCDGGHVFQNLGTIDVPPLTSPSRRAGTRALLVSI